MEKRKSICFVGNHEKTTLTLAKQLNYLLGQYLDIKSWCLQYMEVPIDCYDCDIYVTSSYTALAKIQDCIPPNKKVIVAARTLDTRKLDQVLELLPGTRALVVANSEETTSMAIELLKKMEINYLELIPYYPGIVPQPDKNITLSITTGLTHLVPSHITRTIDLGIKSIDLSTYVELIIEIGLPKELINNISQHYVREIFDLSKRIQTSAQINNNLKRRLEVIINTVGEAILATNNDQEIILINSAFEQLLGINSFSALGKKLNVVLPQVEITSALSNALCIVDKIQQIKNNYYVLNANPILDTNDSVEGVVTTFKPVGQVQELESKVRRELKKRGNIAKYNFSDIIGTSPELQKVTALAYQFAKTDLTILIEGESGTGKELFAQAIHNASDRKNGPFVAINFAALPDNLMESELFGYEEGAFTGAKKGGKPGLFEEAHNGTIFLDEIGDSGLEVQKRLLRVLEEREVRRVGGRTVTPIDVRVIAATNQNLIELVEKNMFRSDLFYRLCTLPLSIPALKDREGDILIFIDFFAQKFYQRKLLLDSPVKEFLLKYSWPGNIREMENVVNYMCSIVPKEETATIKHLPIYLNRNIAPKSDTTFKPYYNENKFELKAQELLNQNLLKIVYLTLHEIESYSSLDKGLGRSTLAKRIKDCTGEDHADHKLRQLLNLLARMEFIESGKTKQGTKITLLGTDFLQYLKKSKYQNLTGAIGK
ncbi:MAG: sigma-54 interaction domain-containing protein [Peptococcaceae bacterium]